MQITTATTADDIFTEMVAQWNALCDEASDTYGYLADAHMTGEIDYYDAEEQAEHDAMVAEMTRQEEAMDRIGKMLAEAAPYISKERLAPREVPHFVREAASNEQPWADRSLERISYHVLRDICLHESTGLTDMLSRIMYVTCDHGDCDAETLVWKTPILAHHTDASNGWWQRLTPAPRGLPSITNCPEHVVAR